jgi:hypothetical protein
MSPSSERRSLDPVFWFVVLGVLVVYASIASQSPIYGDFTRDYTERLASGHTDLSIRPDPKMVAAADPYDPHLNAPRLLDASYYRGRYYVYFGITPYATLLVPWFLLTRHHLAEPVAVALYASAAFVLAAALLRGVCRRYFQGQGRWALIMGVLLIGLANPAMLALRRPAIYELVIVAAWFHLALFLYSLFRALHADRGRMGWLTLGSASLGLAVGSRASYALAAPLFLVWAWLLTTHRFSNRFTRRQWLLGAFLPLAAVGVALAGFNAVRFGNPLEFGFSYQINEFDRSKIQVWAFRNFPFNLAQYLIRPWRLGTYFPFFLGERSGPLTTLKDYGRTEFLYGALTTVPLLALLGAAPWLLRRVAPLGMLAALAAGVACLNLFALSGLINGSFRYQIDVMPALLLVLGWTLLALFAGSWLEGRLRRIARIGVGCLVAFSCGVTFFAQFALLDLFATMNPESYRAMSAFCNRPVFWVQSVLGHRATVPCVTLKLPINKFGQVEPLLVVGEYTLQDFLYAYYAGPGLLQIGFESIGHGGPLSKAFAVDYAVPHTLEIFYGSMVPPDGAPDLEDLTPEQVAVLRRTLLIKLDGSIVLDGPAEFHRTKDLYYWGLSPDDAAFGRTFTGTITARARTPLMDADFEHPRH